MRRLISAQETHKSWCEEGAAGIITVIILVKRNDDGLIAKDLIGDNT